MEHLITESDLHAFAEQLCREEKSTSTRIKYIRSIRGFADAIGGAEVTKELVTRWKCELLERGLAVVTVNASLAALHSFFDFMGWERLRVKYLKRQQRAFCDTSRELTKADYDRLTAAAARGGKLRLALLLEAICATGIRVSEVKYLTLEAMRRGQATVSLKGKTRTILIPSRLAKKLIAYAKKEKIVSGEIFRTKSGKSLSRRQIWGEMKRLAKSAGVEESRVFPHNLRHLFARAFYAVSRDIVKLANVLGHSSIETTRIYLITTCEEHIKVLDRLRLVT